MIARLWHGCVRSAQADAYEVFLAEPRNDLVVPHRGSEHRIGIGKRRCIQLIRHVLLRYVLGFRVSRMIR